MDPKKGLISWFAHNPVAANLLMICILVGGLMSALTINKKIMPTIKLNYISVGVAYPGAAPQEIEQGINIKIEEAIKEMIEELEINEIISGFAILIQYKPGESGTLFSIRLARLKFFSFIKTFINNNIYI